MFCLCSTNSASHNYTILDKIEQISLIDISLEITSKVPLTQGSNARKVNWSCVYSAYILKPVLYGRNL